MSSTFDLLTLAVLPDVGPRRATALRSRGALESVLDRPDDHGDVLPGEAREELRSGNARRRAERELERARSRGERVVGLDDADYPALLRRIYDPPPVLWVRGQIDGDDGARGVAIVGARQATPAGAALARQIARDLAAAGVVIVSGLARGIDSEAHEGCLEAGGRTIAVLGSALDCLYPPENAGLASRIACSGAVASEFPFGTGPHAGNFPRRNRVIAGWGRGVVVVEARSKSGALVTARCALDEGREVLAVPGHPSQPNAEGTNQLLRDGAALVRGAADVAAELGWVIPVTEPAVPGADDLMAVLRPGTPLGLDEIQARSGRSAPELLARLAELELVARVRRLPGGLFVRR
ncbi:MAG: DNA-protecting protein DprA [Acidobacteria bacterium]|nr:MAG: DNA-protecting protein DprA [Acidobacteriota bacterium]